jgi:transposase
MRKVKEVLRLKSQGLSQRNIATSCKISVGAVNDYLRRIKLANLSWPLPEDLSDDALDCLLFPSLHSECPQQNRIIPNWSYISSELRRKGVTLELLWEEYRYAHPDGYGYSWFCSLYRQHSAKLDPRMRIIHKAGEKVFVDYAGMTMNVVDRLTGEVKEVQIFVATLGASDYTYAEATWTQSLEDWIGSHVRAFAFFQGVPKIIVPDNLKSGVKSPCFYEPDINRTFQDLADFYGCAVIPARVRKPRDKAIVENHVRTVEQRVLAPMRNRTFFSLSELNEAISEQIENLNNRSFQKMDGNRRQLFEEIDAPALRSLPITNYIFGHWSKAGVNIDYHIAVEKCYYSVHHKYIGQEVEVKLSAHTVEIFHNNARIASHARLFKPGQFSTHPEHRPKNHQEWGEWPPERLTNWGAKTGPATAKMIEEILSRLVMPEQGYRSCMGIIRLSETYGETRLEAACERALSYGAISFKSVRSILKKNLETAELPEDVPPPAPSIHENLRGADYFRDNPLPDASYDASRTTDVFTGILDFTEREEDHATA